MPEVRSVFVNGGEDDVTKAKLMVNYGPKEERERSSFVIEDELKRDLSQIPDMRINFQNEEAMPICRSRSWATARRARPMRPSG